MTRHQFESALREWLAQGEARVGDGRHGQTPWLWARSDAGDLCHLNADTMRDGVDEYLALGAQAPLEWVVVQSRRGTDTKVAFGPERRVVRGFYLYRPPG